MAPHGAMQGSQGRLGNQEGIAGHRGLRVRRGEDRGQERSEPAMVDFQRKIMESRKAETVPKNSQVGESQANGEAENAINRLQEQIRTMKDRLGSQDQPGHRDEPLDHAMVNRMGPHGAEQIHDLQGWPHCLPQHHRQVIQAAGCQLWRKGLVHAAQDRND